MDDAESTVTYAPWRDRFGAWLLDVVVLRALRIAVRRGDTLGRLSYPAAFGRAFVFAVFWLFYIWILDILWPLWDERSQALHDKIAGSVVVKLDR